MKFKKIIWIRISYKNDQEVRFFEFTKSKTKNNTDNPNEIDGSQSKQTVEAVGTLKEVYYA